MLLSSSNFASTNRFRFAAASVVMDDRIIVTGGLSSENSSEQCFCSKSTTRTVGTSSTAFFLEQEDTKGFHNAKEMIFERYGHALVLMCDVVYVLGGTRNAKNVYGEIVYNCQPPAFSYRINIK